MTGRAEAQAKSWEAARGLGEGVPQALSYTQGSWQIVSSVRVGTATAPVTTPPALAPDTVGAQ